MITAQQRCSELDEVTRTIGRRPTLFSRASEYLRRRLEESGSAVPGQTTLAAGNLTDTLFGDAPTAAFVGAFLGCLTTELFSASGIGPGIASALAAALLCGPLLLTRTTSLFGSAFFPALYGGTFAGMTPIVWLSDSPSGYSIASAGALSVALSIVCGLVFFVVADRDSRSATPIGNGIGGRLGAIAFVGSYLFVELVRLLGADTSRFHTVATGAFDVDPLSAIHGFLACLLGVFGTLVVLRQQRIEGSAPVRTFVASAAALFGLVVLQLGNPDDAHAMDAFYAGCFLGASTRDRLEGWFLPVSGALVLMVLLVLVRTFLPGFGGGLGLAAFIAVMLIVGLSRATAGMTGDRLTGNRSFIAAIAGALIAAFPMIGLISAVPLAREEPISAGTTALESTVETSGVTSARLVVSKPAPGAADDPIPIGISLINGAEDDLVVLSPAPQATTDVAPPLTAGPSAGQLRDAVAVDHEAIYRAFRHFRGQPAPEIRGTARPTRTAAVRPTARVQHVGRQAAAATTDPHLLSGGAINPPQPPVRPRAFSERQKPPAPKRSSPAPRQDRPTEVSASP
jgi:hypothetical protein